MVMKKYILKRKKTGQRFAEVKVVSGDIRETAGAELVAKASFHIVHHGFFGCACSMFIFKLPNVDTLYLRIDKGDTILVYKILYRFLVDVQWREFFLVVDSSRPRRQSMKLNGCHSSINSTQPEKIFKWDNRYLTRTNMG